MSAKLTNLPKHCVYYKNKQGKIIGVIVRRWGRPGRPSKSLVFHKIVRFDKYDSLCEAMLIVDDLSKEAGKIEHYSLKRFLTMGKDNSSGTIGVHYSPGYRNNEKTSECWVVSYNHNKKPYSIAFPIAYFGVIAKKLACFLSVSIKSILYTEDPEIIEEGLILIAEFKEIKYKNIRFRKTTAIAMGVANIEDAVINFVYSERKLTKEYYGNETRQPWEAWELRT